MITVAPEKPGVFARLIIAAYMNEILHNFTQFMISIKAISKLSMTNLQFK